VNQIGDWMLKSIVNLRDVMFRIAIVPRQVLARRSATKALKVPNACGVCHAINRRIGRETLSRHGAIFHHGVLEIDICSRSIYTFTMSMGADQYRRPQ
jgi:hypothetical protein